MEKAKVIQLVADKSERISMKPNSSAQSQVWDNFPLVYVDGQYSSFVTCTRCKTLLRWKKRDGTSTIKSHSESCQNKVLSGQQGNTLLTAPGFSLKKVADPSIPLSVKSSVADAVVNMCAKDIRYANFLIFRTIFETESRLLRVK